MPDVMNGATISFAGAALGRVVSINRTRTGNRIDTTNLGDTFMKTARGIPALEVTVVLLGNVSKEEGDLGQIVITYPDGESQNFGTIPWAIASKDKGGGVNERAENTLVFSPADTN